MSPLNLTVIYASVRASRAGRPLADWVNQTAAQDEQFRTTFVDLADVHLPMDDEPHLPRTQTYTQPHTQAWSETINAADAFVFVMPEYNHSFPAALKNALDHLGPEWADKPAGLVGYGSISGGIRAVQQIKPVMAILRLIVVNEGVIAPFIQKQIVDDRFEPTDIQSQAAQAMLDAVSDWGTMLRARRAA